MNLEDWTRQWLTEVLVTGQLRIPRCECGATQAQCIDAGNFTVGTCCDRCAHA